MKKIIIIAILSLTTGFAFAGNDQTTALKKLINRKISFPEKLVQEATATVEVQLEIMKDGCIEVIASNGNQEIIDFIYEKLGNYKLPYNPEGNNTYAYKFTFKKELSQENK